MNLYDLVSIPFFLFVFFILYKIFKKEKHNNETFETSPLGEHERVVEIKTRKRWLISFLLISFISMIGIFASTMDEENVSVIAERIGIPLTLVISTLFVAPGFWITYHCSFKKRGTAWLSWTMVVLSLDEVVYVAKGEWSDRGEWDSLVWLSVISLLSIKAYYLFNCYQLRRVNSRRIKAESNQEFKNCSECSDCVVKMESSQGISELDKVFAYAINNWPQWEEQISKVYNHKKQLLKGNEKSEQPSS